MKKTSIVDIYKKQLEKRFVEVVNKIQNSVGDKTPVDSKNLKNSLTNDITITDSKMTGIIYFDNVDYAEDVEYGKGREMNYHLEDGTTFKSIGAGMMRKTVDEFDGKLGKEFKISRI